MTIKLKAALSLALLVLTRCGHPVVRGDSAEVPVVTTSGSPAVAEPTYESADLKKRLWVLPFLENAAPQPPLDKVAVADMLQPQIVEVFSSAKSPFIVQDGEQASLRELNVDSSLPPADIAKMARGSGITGYLRGEISTLELKETLSPEGLLKSKTVDLKIGVTYELYDTASARKIAGGNESQTYTETRSDLFGSDVALPELDRKIRELSQKLAQRMLARIAPHAEKMGWEGRVLRTDSSRIYINAGRRTGIQVGDTLKVVDAAKDISDPQTGAYVGRAPGRMKGTLKIIQYFGLDGSIAVIQSGGGVRAGDRVELY